jgi:Zn-dependent protease with chaperone function
MSGFLLCIVAIVIGFSRSAGKTKPVSLPAVVLCIGAGSLICLLLAFYASKRSAHLLSRGGKKTAAQSFLRMRRIVWLSVLSFYALLIHALSYDLLIGDERYLGLGAVPVASEILILAPFFLFAVSALVGLRPGENLLRGKDWRTGDYISFHLRQFALPVAPFLIFSGFADTVSYFPAIEEEAVVHSFVTVAGLVLLIFLFMLFAPLLLRLVWKTEPLAAGELRDGLEQLARDSGVRVREILVWRTGGSVANAVVTGLVGSLRYVFLTDGLLTSLSNREIESVFAHEIGHSRQKHLIVYFCLIISFLFIASFLEEPAGSLLSSLQENISETFSLLYTAYTFGLLFLFWFVIFGYVSRRLEHSADIFALERVGGEPFATALERITQASGGARFLSTWRHFSAEKRAQFARAWEAGKREKESRSLALFLALLLGGGIILFLVRTGMDLSRPESETLALRAEYRYNRKDLTGAEELLRKAIQISPVEAKYHYHLGLILLREGEKERALTEFETALALAPGEKKYREIVRELRESGNYPGD